MSFIARGSRCFRQIDQSEIIGGGLAGEKSVIAVIQRYILILNTFGDQYTRCNEADIYRKHAEDKLVHLFIFSGADFSFAWWPAVCGCSRRRCLWSRPCQPVCRNCFALPSKPVTRDGVSLHSGHDVILDRSNTRCSAFSIPPLRHRASPRVGGQQ